MKGFADKLAAKSPAFQRTYLGILAPSLVKSGNFDKYYQTLTDFDFMLAKINHPEFGVRSLIDDYKFIDNSQIFDNPERVKILKLIEGALELSAHLLNKNQVELLSQLWGRLLSFELPGIKAFLTITKQTQFQPWLRPLIPSLDPPGRTLLRTLTGHSSSVDAITITSNGKFLISGSNDKSLKVWNLETGREDFSLRGHTDKINTIAVTPNGKLLISGSSDKTIKVWNLDTKTEVFIFKGHTDQITSVTITPSNKRVLSASEDKTIKVWNLKTRRAIKTLTGHSKKVNHLALMSYDRLIISGSDDKTLKVWDLETGSELIH
ncbi:hypothetical protein A6770_12745 [Nostoc minutum NIES-26]|uniref:Uncharacterized protein n=1 Tax=Nostoc minutum NIES-26 TaxID=1844469 RepID=A0A367RQD0_9NOSO|nr:hypothetical protein A6770_12745 [Nostoc minutum NIES-26]